MRTAETREEFVQAWRRQIDQFAGLVLVTSDPMLGMAKSHYDTARAHLLNLIELAADAAFPPQQAQP